MSSRRPLAFGAHDLCGVVPGSHAMSDFYCERVLNGLEAVEVVFEDADVVAYHHTRPFFDAAHVVVVPKAHVSSLLDQSADSVLPPLLKVVRRVAAQVLDEHGSARVLTNLGEYQDSKHLHWHVYSGAELSGSQERDKTGRERNVLPIGEPA